MMQRLNRNVGAVHQLRICSAALATRANVILRGSSHVFKRLLSGPKTACVMGITLYVAIAQHRPVARRSRRNRGSDTQWN